MGVNIKRIFLKNFTSLYTATGLDEIEINRESSNRIILVLGGNGSGKSSLLNEITPLPLEHTLYRNKSRILPDTIGIKELDMILDDIEYRCQIVYEKKKTTCYFMKDGIEMNANGNVSSYIELLDKELGLSKNYTKVGFLSNDITNFISMKPSERNEYISEWLPDISIFLKAYKSAIKLYNSTKKEINTYNVEIGKLNDIDYDLELSKIRTEMEAISNRIDLYNSKFAIINLYYDKASVYIDQFKNLKKLRKSFNERRSYLIGQFRAIHEKHMILQTYGDQESANIQMKELEEEVTSIQSSIVIAEANVSRLELEIESKSKNVSEDKDERPLLELDEYIKSLEAEISIKTDTLVDLAKSNKKLIKLSKGMSKYNVKMLYSMFNHIIDLSEGLNDVSDLELPDIENQIEKFTSDIKSYQVSLIDLESEKKSMDNIKYIKDLLNNKDIINNCKNHDCLLMERLKDYITFGGEAKRLISTIRITNDNIRISEKALENAKNKILTIKEDTIVKNRINDYLFKQKDEIAHFSVFWVDLLAENSIEKISKAILDYNGQIPSYIEYVSLLEDIENLKNIVGNTKNIRNNIIIKNNLQDNISELDKIKKDIKELVMSLHNKKLILDELVDIEISRFNLNNFIASYNKEVELFMILKTNYTNLIKNEYYFNHIKELKDNMVGNIKKLKYQYKELESKKEDFNTKVINKAQLISFRDTCIDKLKLYEILGKIWSPKIGYPSWEIEDFLYTLQEETNNDLKQIWGSDLLIEDFNVGLSEFSIKVNRSGSILDDASEASSGEKATLASALSFGIIETNLKNRKYNVLRLDEVDSVFDVTRRKNFLSIILERIEAMDCESCFIISHNNEFDNVEADIILLNDANISKENLQNKNIIFKL